jgi:DNA-binding NarL/FixJ family response regulator
MSPIRVVIADDDVLLRAGLASLLERSGFEIVGQAGDGSELLGLVREHPPDLVVVDIRMPPTNTTEGIRLGFCVAKVTTTVATHAPSHRAGSGPRRFRAYRE